MINKQEVSTSVRPIRNDRQLADTLAGVTSAFASPTRVPVQNRQAISSSSHDPPPRSRHS